jgi:hypothetical protein
MCAWSVDKHVIIWGYNQAKVAEKTWASNIHKFNNILEEAHNVMYHYQIPWSHGFILFQAHVVFLILRLVIVTKTMYVFLNPSMQKTR